MMPKRKKANPLGGHSPYSEILGVDPSQIRERVRRDSDVSKSDADNGPGEKPQELLTSQDLFGDILATFPKSDPAPASAQGASVLAEEKETEAPAAEEMTKAEEMTPAEKSTALEDENTEPTDGDALEHVDVDDAYESLLGEAELGVEDSVLDDRVLQYGDYFLLDRIAEGGMAEVFRATRRGVEGFEKVVAVKRILPRLSSNQAFVGMFIEEAKVAASLSHPNIAQIFDLGKIDQSYFIAMEFVPGWDLRTILKRARQSGRVFDVHAAAAIVTKVCAALEYAHRHRDADGNELRIVHRDVSPQNILISSEGDVKLVDFGIAKAVTKASHTDAGSLRGKLLYMSPEQASGAEIDKRSDIFSLGAVFFELLTGHVLFSGSSKMSILERVREARFTKPSSLNKAVPIELDAVVTRALRKDLSERYQDAGEMHADLEAYRMRRPSTTPQSLSAFVRELFPTGG